MRWVTLCGSWRIKVLSVCLVLLVALSAVKVLYLDSSSGVEECAGAACQSRFAALHSDLEHPLQEQVVPRPPNQSLPILPTTRPTPPHLRAPRGISPHLPAPGGTSSRPPAKPHLAPPQPLRFHNLTQEEVAGVERFTFFIGYGRSGHSIVGSIMDAHQNVIIAHEYYLFDKLTNPYLYRGLQTKANLFDALYWSSYSSAVSGWRSAKETTKGYNLNLQGTWQGQFQRLKVIGDKTGGSTVMLYHKSPQLFKTALKWLQRITGVPYSAVHVVRNPYDMVATVAMYQASSDPNVEKVHATVANKFRSPSFLGMAADIVLRKAAGVQAMVKNCRLSVLEIHLEDLISSPEPVIRGMCDFLGVACTEEYVKACRGKVFRHASRSRDLVLWPEAIRNRIELAIQRFSFFNRYSFEGQ